MWASSSLFFGSYVIAEKLNVAIQVSPSAKKELIPDPTSRFRYIMYDFLGSMLLLLPRLL